MNAREALAWLQSLSEEDLDNTDVVITKKNKTPSQYREAFISAVHERGSLTFPEAKELGIIPQDMKGDTFRKCVVKGSKLSKQTIKKGVPVIYHTEGNERKEAKKFEEVSEEAAESVIPLFNGYTTVDPLKVMVESGNYNFVKDLENDKSKKIVFLDMVSIHAIKEGWVLNSQSLRFTKKQEVQL